MRKLTVSFTALAAALLILTGSCSPQKAEVPKEEIPLDSWLAGVSDTMKVCKLSIPGTHDALTAEGFTDPSFQDDYTTQVATLEQQLDGGIRYLDIRLLLAESAGNYILHTCHRTATLKLTFEQLLEKAEKFLQDHPSEFLILKIQYDGDKTLPAFSGHWSEAVQKVLTDSRHTPYFAAFRPDLRVSDLRGKILLLSRTDYGEPVCGAMTNWTDEGTDDYVEADSVKERTLVLAPTREAAQAYCGGDNPMEARLFVQDFYNSIGSRMEAKLDAVESMFESARQLPESENVWILNHTSGFSDPKMNALGYAENAARSNACLLSLLQKDPSRKGVGIIAMDYAGIDTLNQKIGTLGVIRRVVWSKTLTKTLISRNLSRK